MASIRERTSKTRGTTWSVLFRHGGKQTSESFTMRRAPRSSGIIAAEEFKALIEAVGVDEAYRRLNREETSGLTVDELFDQWLDWKATTVAPRTIKDYERDYDNWIRPRFGSRHAAAVDELDVQKWVDAMSKRLDPKSVGDRHMILSSMFKYGAARSRRLVPSNPCTETSLPAKKKKAPKGFTLPEWDAMHAWARANEPDADDLLTFIAWTGWRFSEATPLTPRAVDDRGDVAVTVDGRDLLIPDVHVAVLGVHRVDADYKVTFAEGEAKSRAGMRRINLPPEAAAVVRRRLVGLGNHDLIFTNSRGKRWHAQNFLQREFQRILDGAKIKKVDRMGPHYLRHTHVAMLDRAGIGPSSIQRRIGHENINTTFGVYGGQIGNTLSPEELVRLDAVASREPVGRTIVAGEVVRGEIG